MNRNGFWLMLLLQTILLAGKLSSWIDIGWGITLLPIIVYAAGFGIMYLCLVLWQNKRKKKIKKEG